MEAVCPTCQSVIDPTRAPVARIRGAKVLTFCSTACAEGKPAVAAKPVPAPEPAPAPKPAPAPAAAKPKPAPQAQPQPQPHPPAPKPVAAPRSASEAPSVVPEMIEAEPPRRRRSRGFIIGASLVLLAGTGVVAIDFWPSSHGNGTAVASASDAVPTHEGAAIAADVPAAVAADPAAAEEAAAEDAPIDPKRLHDRAVTELRELLSSRSRRVQRISAMALARMGDKDALEVLEGMLEDEESPLIEVQIAYALARAGDAKGREVLVGALRNKLRDVKLDAARSLVQLGDDHGADQLRDMLSYKHYRIGAAGLLARLGDDKGFDVLRQERKGSRSSHEIVMRATVALGSAGDQEVAADLVEILEDGRYQVGAAHALATLGNKAAIPSLTRQLDIDAFRVQAALGLRRMNAEVDLEPLASALHTGNEVVRASAGEAILILTGDAALSERD